MAGDTREWFVAGYYASENIKPEYSEFNPFGAWFRLSPWTCSDEKIDQHEPRPYKRTPVEFTENKEL